MTQLHEHIVIGLGTWGVGHFQPRLWRDPRIPFDASVNFPFYKEWAQQAERAKLDFVFLADSQFINKHSNNHELNRFEPFTILSALSAVTDTIGLVATASTSYNSPYNIARRFASLELINGGRSGWNVVASHDDKTALNFGLSQHYDHDTRYRRALEHVQVVRGLWDSYEPGAFPADLANDKFFDSSKLHVLDHHGEFFDVLGPIAVDRSPQGQPVIFQAGGSPQGQDFAGHVAEVAFGVVQSQQHSLEYANRIRSIAADDYGRDPRGVLFVPWLTPVIGESHQEALDIARAQFEEDNSFDALIEKFGRPFNWHDFNQYDPDAPFPVREVASLTGLWPEGERILEEAAKNRWTLRETVRITSHADSFEPPLFTGTRAEIANELSEWFRAGALDGMKVVFRTPDDTEQFTEGVVPLLQERGLFRTEYESSTLRGHLGLPVPENRYTESKRPQYADDTVVASSAR